MRFQPLVIEELARHGLRPRDNTPVELLHKQVHDLYLFEIRHLRDRCKAGEFPRRELAGHVVALRRRYVLLSTPAHEWLSADGPSEKRRDSAHDDQHARQLTRPQEPRE